MYLKTDHYLHLGLLFAKYISKWCENNKFWQKQLINLANNLDQTIF